MPRVPRNVSPARRQLTSSLLLAVLSALVAAHPAGAQTLEVAGTRAAGMGGAFVAVADDASAVYWNPAGLASGAFFSIVLDRTTATASDDSDPQAGSQSSTFVALGVPALGLSYYRLRGTTVAGPLLQPASGTPAPLAPQGVVQVGSLITHHTGVTLVQSLTDRIAVGTTLKVVHGIAAAGLVPFTGDRDDLLDEAGGLVGNGSTTFDADIGVMAAFENVKAGLTLRNVREPEFEAAGGAGSLRLERQVRAGVALTLAQSVLLAADLDLRSVPGTTGRVRNFAAGAEAPLTRRATVRAGFRFNTRGDEPAGRTPVGTVGASFAVRASVFVDGYGAFGSESADRGWGVGARVMF